ncbi:hypothetical protein BDP27DRAFT_1316276, partial [Rhodocollybia butyracea]
MFYNLSCTCNMQGDCGCYSGDVEGCVMDIAWSLIECRNASQFTLTRQTCTLLVDYSNCKSNNMHSTHTIDL